MVVLVLVPSGVKDWRILFVAAEVQPGGGRTKMSDVALQPKGDEEKPKGGRMMKASDVDL